MTRLDTYDNTQYYGFVMVLPAGFDEAGFTDRPQHLADRKVPHGVIFIPGRVWLEGETIRWQNEIDYCKHIKPGKSMLHQFVALRSGDAASIERFAKRWGPLRHDLTGQPDYSNDGSEPLSYWRFLAERAYATLACAVELKAGRRPPETELALISTPHRRGEKSATQPEFGFPNWSRREITGEKLGVDRMRDILAGELTFWLERFSPSLSVSWSQKNSWHLEVTYLGRALPAIALQLALEVSGGDLFICDGCHKPYIRADRRRPNLGQQNYCNECGLDVARRNADKRRRAKRIKARRLHARGVALSEIARQLDTSSGTVSGWVKKKGR